MNEYLYALLDEYERDYVGHQGSAEPDLWNKIRATVEELDRNLGIVSDTTDLLDKIESHEKDLYAEPVDDRSVDEQLSRIRRVRTAVEEMERNLKEAHAANCICSPGKIDPGCRLVRTGVRC